MSRAAFSAKNGESPPPPPTPLPLLPPFQNVGVSAVLERRVASIKGKQSLSVWADCNTLKKGSCTFYVVELI
uniref:Uncharacterized protein n=1 Tax=Romanomermis culicivorax TaxID=13658 RepID=A0A915I471_ROMCU